MIIVNNQTLPVNAAKDHPLYEYVKEYQDGIRDLKTRFPNGIISLKRNGYPKINRNPDGTINMPEVPPPIFIKYTRAFDGILWAYCQGRPLIHPNGLVEVPPNDNSELVSQEVWHIDLHNKPDYAFFIMYKSGLLGTNYTIYDPEGDKLRELAEKNARLKVQATIREMDEDKLRMMASAWGISGAGTRNPLLLQEDLENLVFRMDDEKKRDPSNLTLKGVAEFLADIKNDEVTRPKAILKMGIDEKKITFNARDSKFYFNGAELCYIPLTKHAERDEYLYQAMRNPENKDKWLQVIVGLVDKNYVNSMDKYGLRWLAAQFGIPLNKKEDELRTALLAEFA